MTSPIGLEPTTPSEATSGTKRSRGTFRRIFRRPSTAVALGFVVAMVLVAITWPWLVPYDPEDKDFSATFQGPSATHLLGTDEFGQDAFSRLLAGSRIALVVSVGSVALAAIIGVPFGLLLGYRGGWWDRFGSRVIDISDALPGLLVAFAVIAILGRGLWSIVLAIGLIFSMGLARMTRAVTLAEREKEYVEAAHVSGFGETHILFKQILPNLIVPLTAQASLMMGAAIIIESTLSFLSIGIEEASWGGMLSQAAENLSVQPFLAVPPGVAIVLAVLSLNLVANGITDVVGGTSVGVLRKASGAIEDASESVPPTSGSIDGWGPTLEIRGVTVELPRASGDPVPLVQDAWLSVGRGEVVGLLGESGSGKSMLARSVLGLLPRPIYLASGSVQLNGTELVGLSEREMLRVRGNEVAAVFQSPTTAFSPVHTIGQQVIEPLRIHLGMSKRAARERAAELLDLVGVENPRTRLDDYPHEFSGGMAQRVAIAMALAAEPKLLIADEATSALDVTTQAQVLDLLLDLRDSMDMSILLITHDLGVVAETCDRVAVMYAGQIVEVNDIRSVFDSPHHPYTAALLASNPAVDHDLVGRRHVIAGRVPPPGEWPKGCHFAGRCDFVEDQCREAPVQLVEGVRCVRTGEIELEGASR